MRHLLFILLFISGQVRAESTISFGANGAVTGGSCAANNFTTSINSSGVPSCARPACADLSNSSASCSTDATNASNLASGTVPAARLPLPAAAALGGVFSKAVVTNNFLTGISSVDGSVSQARPACADLSNAAASCATDATVASNIASGTLPAGRMPAFTGDSTVGVGTVAIVAAATQANIVTLSNAAGVAVHGANTNTAAATGYVGEILGPITRLRSNNTSLTTNVTVNIGTTTSVTLTAGHWLVSGMVAFYIGGATTTVTELDAAISATSATLPATGTLAVPTAGEVWVSQIYNALALGAGATDQDVVLNIAPYVVNVANGATLALFLVARGTFAVSTMAAYGSMYAVRIW